MLQASASTSVAMPADELWDCIGRFGAVGEWHPMMSRLTTDGDREGATRSARTPRGGLQLERLIEVRPDEHRYRYAVLITPMPIRNSVGDFHVRDNRDGTCTVEWSETFEVASGPEGDALRMVQDFLRSGLDNLRRLYG